MSAIHPVRCYVYEVEVVWIGVRTRSWRKQLPLRKWKRAAQEGFAGSAGGIRRQRKVFVPRLMVRESISGSVGIVGLDRLDVIESAVVAWQ